MDDGGCCWSLAASAFDAAGARRLPAGGVAVGDGTQPGWPRRVGAGCLWAGKAAAAAAGRAFGVDAAVAGSTKATQASSAGRFLSLAQIVAAAADTSRSSSL